MRRSATRAFNTNARRWRESKSQCSRFVWQNKHRRKKLEKWENVSVFHETNNDNLSASTRWWKKVEKHEKKDSQTAHRKLPLVDERIIGKNYCSAFHERQKSPSRYRQRLCNLQCLVLFSVERKRHWNYVLMCFNVTPVGRLCCEHDAQQNIKFCGFQSPPKVRQWCEAFLRKQQTFLRFIFFGLVGIRAVNRISINLHHFSTTFYRHI